MADTADGKELLTSEDSSDDAEAAGSEAQEASCCGDGNRLALRQKIGLVLTALVVVVFVATENIAGLTEKQHTTLGIFLLVVIFWVTELFPIPITGLLVGPLFIICQVASAKEVMSGYFGSVSLLLYGSFILAIAMEAHGLDTRIAHALVSLKCVGDDPARLRAIMMCTGMVMSMFISNTATANILVPIILKFMNAKKDVPLEDSTARRSLTGGLLSMAYACGAGGMGTLIGTPPNLIAQTALEADGIEISFPVWMLIGVPMAVLVNLAIFGVLWFTFKPEPTHGAAKGAEVPRPTRRKGLSWGEKVTVGSFLLTLCLWLFPAMYRAAGGQYHVIVKKTLNSGVAVIIGTLPLFVIPDRESRDNARVVPWSKARTADWGIPVLVGGGVVLGSQLRNTGLATVMANCIVSGLGITDIWVLTFVVILITIFATEVTSNTATASIMIPIVTAASKSITTDIGLETAPVVGVAFAASCAFMMPIATPPNYIVKDTGHIELTDMVKVGAVLNTICVFAIWLLLRILVPVILAFPGVQAANA